MWLRLRGGEQGFFARYERGVWLLPRSFEVVGVHSGREIEPYRRRPMHRGELAVARDLAMAAAAWCERYERWLVATEGVEHRQRTLNKWKHAVVEPEGMVDAWRRARSIYDRWYTTPGGLEGLLSREGVGRMSGFDFQGVTR